MIPWLLKNKIVAKHWIWIVQGFTSPDGVRSILFKTAAHEPSQSPVTELNTWIRLFPRSATHTWTPEEEYRAVNTASVSYSHNPPDCWSAVRRDLKGEVHPQTKSAENMQIIWDERVCYFIRFGEMCLSNGCSAVNGCRQNESLMKTSQHSSPSVTIWRRQKMKQIQHSEVFNSNTNP